MIFTESDAVCNLFQIQFFCIVLVYIIQQIIEFLNIFLLLIGSHVREEVLRLNMVVAEFYKQIDQKSINGKLGIFVLAEIFIAHSGKKVIHILIDMGIGFFCHE